MRFKLFRRIRYEIIKIARAHATTHEIAIGAAIGTFVSIFPTFGTGTLIVLLLYRLLNFNLVAAISGSLISNFFTAPFFLYLSYEIGALIIKPTVPFNIKTWYKNLDEAGLAVITGNMILSTICSILIYFMIKFTVRYYRKHKMKFPHPH